MINTFFLLADACSTLLIVFLVYCPTFINRSFTNLSVPHKLFIGIYQFYWTADRHFFAVKRAAPSSVLFTGSRGHKYIHLSVRIFYCGWSVKLTTHSV
jgi:hypothetical protein